MQSMPLTRRIVRQGTCAVSFKVIVKVPVCCSTWAAMWVPQCVPVKTAPVHRPCTAVSVLQMFVTAHQSVEAMSRSMWQALKRHNYVTPTNYLETVRNYKALLAEKRSELLAKSDKLKGGLTKLDETRVQVHLSCLNFLLTQSFVCPVL